MENDRILLQDAQRGPTPLLSGLAGMIRRCVGGVTSSPLSRGIQLHGMDGSCGIALIDGYERPDRTPYALVHASHVICYQIIYLTGPIDQVPDALSRVPILANPADDEVHDELSMFRTGRVPSVIHAITRCQLRREYGTPEVVEEKALPSEIPRSVEQPERVTPLDALLSACH